MPAIDPQGTGGAGGLGSWVGRAEAVIVVATSPGRSAQSRHPMRGVTSDATVIAMAMSVRPYGSILEPAIDGLITHSTAASQHMRPEHWAPPLARPIGFRRDEWPQNKRGPRWTDLMNHDQLRMLD
jgi:hypothetical protein